MNEDLCAVCANGWNGAQSRREVYVDRHGHKTWYICTVCQSIWIETERYAVRVTCESVPKEIMKMVTNG